ncbi:MAG: phosphate acyltransferase PlsX [Chitinophagaceae bacterium]
MTIGLDMMGGDFAPLEAVKGIVAYLQEKSDPDAPAHLVLIGDEAKLTTLLTEYAIPEASYTLVPSTQVIEMHEHPTKALKEKPDSSIAKGFGLLKKGETEAFISAGNTGAMLVGTIFSIKAIEGVIRPTIATIVPHENGKTGLILDVGINADCKPEMLNQFAVLGSGYAEYILGIENPRVGLINIGEEEGKGNILAQATYPLLKENTAINFIGNIEGRDILEDKADIMICDGFTGNILLKLLESLHPITERQGIHHPYFDRFNFEQYGGTPVLGVEKPVVIGHGISAAKAFKNMILLAEKMVKSQMLGKMREILKG